MKTKKISLVYVLLIGIISFSSCKDAMTEITTLNVNQAFSPTGLVVTIVNKTGARLSWNKVNNAETYTIELFANGNLDFSGTPIKVIEGVLFTQAPYTIPALAGATSYSVRIKAIGTGIEDSKYVSASFKTDPEQIFQDIVPAKLTSKSVTLNWPAGQNATSLTITPGNIVHTITTAEIAAGEVTITGLTPKVTYTATLLLNTAIRGTKIFTTPAELPTGADVVYLSATDDLGAMIQAATKSTRFVILEGTKYNSDVTITLPSGIDISIIGEVAAVKPIVSISLITLPTTGGKLHFENVDVTGYANGDVATAKRQYLINQSAATNMDEVSFENCNIRNFVNTPMRVQGSNAITINKVIVNNCLVDDIGDNNGGGTYAFINSNVASGKFNNITITNSTFSNLGYGLILHSNGPSLSVAVENNTFYNVIGDARYFIDYNAQTVASGFSVKNNIIGKTLSPLATGRGIRSATVPITTNNYKTSDAVFAGNAIPGIIDYAGAASALFTAPASKNFKIKDDAFAGKATAGDPRWRL